MTVEEEYIKAVTLSPTELCLVKVTVMVVSPHCKGTRYQVINKERISLLKKEA